tara:strand:+ start:1130 stop:1276 length:147 start_codon:yes stop_codon:yes gene_type:complete
MNTYTVIDCHTKEELKTYKTRKSANRAADKKNINYGAHRYSVIFTVSA